ncbi:hypothetical protein FAEPRAA2165_01529 [Faecalibacterium duncaniae]|jgi:hypothetical protein|uniref:Uncharacterized protein n=1 Tax=Faecalibacterium duncaniae (strain DSM 17677 / JCM 31915 / A2-165) TaxID=411483 RepID=C7H5F8_FAED2|nr:hypothetical protein FAEPRAA2165_01529 [Faecalibacterium duncaniae]
MEFKIISLTILPEMRRKSKSKFDFSATFFLQGQTLAPKAKK